MTGSLPQCAGDAYPRASRRPLQPGCSAPRGCCSRSRWPARSSCCSAGKRTNSWGHLVGVAMPVAVFVYGVIAFVAMLGYPADQRGRELTLFTWIRRRPVPGPVGLRLDQLSICFVLLITGVGSLIHIFAVGYMSHDPERRRFFGYMNLFVAAMLLLVLADNYLVLYVGLGGRRPGLLPAHRLLAVQARRRDRGQEGVHRQPGRRRRPVAGDHADVRAVRLGDLHRRLRRRSARPARAWSPRSGCCCCSAPAASRPSCRCSPGCWTRWRARPRCRP